MSRCIFFKSSLQDTLRRADFRKDYQAIGGVIRERFGGLPVTALTATATARVQADVKASLGMADCACFQVGHTQQREREDARAGLLSTEGPHPDMPSHKVLSLICRRVCLGLGSYRRLAEIQTWITASFTEREACWPAKFLITGHHCASS